MRIYKDINENLDEIAFEIECGAVFIYPTDTIYGIGCNALDSAAVKKIREIKKRDQKPFSVIAPSKEWIERNCEIDKKYLKKLPGKYTLILKIKNKECIAPEVSKGKLGVRIPKHEISKLVEKLGFPIVTTSVNLSGENPTTSLKTLKKEIEKMVDFAIDEGKLEGKPSKVIDMTTKKILRT